MTHALDICDNVRRLLQGFLLVDSQKHLCPMIHVELLLLPLELIRQEQVCKLVLGLVGPSTVLIYYGPIA